MTYTPQPGTIPARVIAWLQQQPKGAMFASAVLADAVDCDVADITGSLRYVAERGGVCLEKRAGRSYWGLSALDCSMWADGRLVVRRGAEVVTFSVDEVRALRAFLDKPAGAN